MTRRSVRVTLVCLGVLVTAALAYRVLLLEQDLSSQRQQLSHADSSIDEVLLTLSDVRGVLHAYVAPGQRSSVWETRSAELFDKLRQQLIALDAMADASGRSLNDSLDNLDQLTAAEKRVQRYLDFSQPLLAGDVIFTEIRDLVDATGTQVKSVRDVVRQDGTLRIEKAQRDQAMLAGAGILLWFLLACLLALIPGRARDQAAASASIPASSPEAFDLSLTSREPVSAPPPTPTVPPVTESPAPVTSPEALRWESISTVCKELSSVKEMGSLTGALARACDALRAKDAIVWVASADGATLTPLASHGFDPRVLARIGSISRDSANLTAAAFRDGNPRQSRATASSPEALAVAVRGPSGPVGVFSAELQHEGNGEDAVDLATIFAAQITPLVLQTQAAAPDMPQRRQA